MNKNVQDNLVFINGIISDKLSPVWLEKWGTVYEAVCVVQTEKQTAFKSAHHFIWRYINDVNKNLMPYFSTEIQVAWVSIYCLLVDKIGLLVHNEVQRVEKERQIWIEAVKRISDSGENCVAVWSMANPCNLDEKYPVDIKELHYTNESGWGHPGVVSLSENATYFDIFKAVNKLVVDGGDFDHKFLENIVSIPMKEGSYRLSMGS